MTFDETYQAIVEDKTNAWAKEKNYKPLFTASKEAKIVIIGQAPGIKAQESMQPWNDKSGDKLCEWLGITRGELLDPKLISIIPMDFYYPGKGKSGDLPPRKDFADMWHPQILKSMPNVQLVILIGTYAQKHYLGSKQKNNLTETVKAYKEYLPKYFPTVHPSPLNFRWQSKNPWFAKDVLPELKSLVANIIK